MLLLGCVCDVSVSFGSVTVTMGLVGCCDGL